MFCLLLLDVLKPHLRLKGRHHETSDRDRSDSDQPREQTLHGSKARGHLLQLTRPLFDAVHLPFEAEAPALRVFHVVVLAVGEGYFVHDFQGTVYLDMPFLAPTAGFVVRPLSETPRGVLIVRGVAKPIKNEDILTVAKMLQGEGAADCALHAATVIWTVLQRQAYLGQQNTGTKTFLEAFSQPINPIWQRGGSACAPGRPERNDPYCTESHYARRERITSLTWDTLAPEAKIYASLWAAGALPNPVPGSIDFAAWPVGSTKAGYKPVARFGRNVFYIDENRRTQNWDGTQAYIADSEGTRISEAIAPSSVLDAVAGLLSRLLPGRRRPTSFTVRDLLAECRRDEPEET